MKQLRVGDVVLPTWEAAKIACPCGADKIGPAIVTEFSNVAGNVYVRRPFEHRMIYVFRIEDLEIVASPNVKETGCATP